MTKLKSISHLRGDYKHYKGKIESSEAELIELGRTAIERHTVQNDLANKRKLGQR